MPGTTKPKPDQEHELSPAELRRQAAEAGEVDAIWRELTEHSWGEFNLDEVLNLLLRALEVKARQDPTGFAEAFFERATAFSTLLSLRLQLLITWKLGTHDGRRRRPYEPARRRDRQVAAMPNRTPAACC